LPPFPPRPPHAPPSPPLPPGNPCKVLDHPLPPLPKIRPPFWPFGWRRVPLAPLQMRPQEFAIVPSARGRENPMDTGRDTAAERAAAAEAGAAAQAATHDSKPPASMPAARGNRHAPMRQTRRD
jgi:hypothetical protein